MIKNVLCGVAVGVANIIPGVSGGTIMVILGLFDKVIESVSNVFKVKNPNRFKDLFFLFQVLLGGAIGLVVFAKIIDWLFNNYPNQTLFWFVGLIALSIPSLLKNELKGNKVSWIPMLVGILIIFMIVYLNPGEKDINIVNFPELNPIFLIELIFIGIIVGGTMLMPGVSGSMVLLIIGEYYLFKSYVANVTTFDFNILLPLFFIAIGVALGILISAKLTSYFLKNYRRGTVSLILGLIIASCIVLIPINVNYNLYLMTTCLFSFIFGAIVIIIIERLV